MFLGGISTNAGGLVEEAFLEATRDSATEEAAVGAFAADQKLAF